MELDTLFTRIACVFSSLLNCWQVKLACGVVFAVISYLFGPINEAFLALWLLVVIDPITRWLAIGRETLRTAGIEGGLLTGLKLAWKNQDINSLGMRTKFVPKIIGYALGLIAVNALVKTMPPIYYAGKLLTESPRDVVIVYLAVTEFISILENLGAAGVEASGKLAAFFCTKRDQILK